ncbi:Centrosomal protein of 70 kDa [Lamellibrachia satsuma]|nr:Centrosomal protein of 70 kDa [Lamellibrachia satsuma]
MHEVVYLQEGDGLHATFYQNPHIIEISKAVQVELDEWSRINRELRQHGLSTVDILRPDSMTQATDVVMLDADASRTMRMTLKTLVQDCDRRQELVQELITTNTQLKEEMTAQTNLNQLLEEKVKALQENLQKAQTAVEVGQTAVEVGQTTVEVGQTAVESLETDSSLLEKDGEQLRSSKNSLLTRHRQLQSKCNALEDEIDRLKRKMRRMTEEDERRLLRKNELSLQLKQLKGHDADDKFAELVDSYESQISVLKKQLQVTGGAEVTVSSEVTPKYKSLIKSYEKQLREAKSRINSQQNEVEILKLELESRPQVKDLRSLQVRTKRLERLLREYQQQPGGLSDVDDLDTKYSTKVSHLLYLPPFHCRNYLKRIAEQLSVSDLDDIRPELEQKKKALEGYPRLEQFAKEVVCLIDSKDICRPTPDPKILGGQSACSEQTLMGVTMVLGHWRHQLAALKELHQSANKLIGMLLPWKQFTAVPQAPSVTEIINLVDSVIFEQEREERQGIVRHAQKLFDVRRTTGLYAKLNDVYTRHGELRNVVNTLKDLLGLAPDAKSSAVVNSVAHLCQALSGATYRHMSQTLSVTDLESVIRKLKEHDEFFPIFREVMGKLMETLNVSRMDQVLPTVKALLLLASR